MIASSTLEDDSGLGPYHSQPCVGAALEIEALLDVLPIKHALISTVISAGIPEKNKKWPARSLPPGEEQRFMIAA